MMGGTPFSGRWLRAQSSCHMESARQEGKSGNGSKSLGATREREVGWRASRWGILEGHQGTEPCTCYRGERRKENLWFEQLDCFPRWGSRGSVLDHWEDFEPLNKSLGSKGEVRVGALGTQVALNQVSSQ